MIRPHALPSLAFLLLTGCIGGTIDAPSLSTRDIEARPVPVPDEAREPESALDPALAVKLKALLDQANAAHAAFTATEAKVSAAINRAAGTSPGGESWTVAQQELSALDTSRSPLQGIEADVDSLRGDPANATPANRAAIDALQAQVQALGDQEQATIAALGAKLKS